MTRLADDALSNSTLPPLKKTTSFLIEACAQLSSSSEADLRDPLTVPQALVKAHKKLDTYVDAAFQPSGGNKTYASDAERLAFLMELYQRITRLPSAAIVKKTNNQKHRKLKSMLTKRIHCEDALDYFKQVEQMGRRSWAYRGHSRFADDGPNNWKLESSLDRFLRNHRGKAIRSSSWYPREAAQINRFRGAAHIHLSHLPNESDKLAWLALMQHYGSPTRLLDFSFNPAAALYFALRESGRDTGPYSIHALHIDSVRGRAKVARENLPEYQKKAPPFNPKTEEYGIGRKPAAFDFVGFFDGSKLNPRQEAQDGLFMVPSRIDLDIEDWLHENLIPIKTIKPHDTPWVEFVFNNEQDNYYKVVNQLVQVGMTAKRLFPGLEGICESMKYSWLEVAKNLEPFDL